MFIPFIGTTHAEDLSFLFYPHMLKELNLNPPEPGSEKHKVVEYFTQMWTDFAKTGYAIQNFI